MIGFINSTVAFFYFVNSKKAYNWCQMEKQFMQLVFNWALGAVGEGKLVSDGAVQ